MPPQDIADALRRGPDDIKVVLKRRGLTVVGGTDDAAVASTTEQTQLGEGVRWSRCT